MLLQPAERDPVNVADWVELEVLYSNEGRLSFETLRSQIDTDGTIYEQVDEIGEPDMLLPELSEGLVASTEVEIDRRIRIVGQAYPFERSGGLLQQRTDFRDCIPYIFCLLAVDRELYDPSDPIFQGLPALFEHLVCEAMVSYLGGEAVRFGEPRDTMPARINDAVKELARLTGDKQVDVYEVNATDKDEGLDVAAWKNFSDKYLSKLEVYMQCATGTNWRGKKEDCKLYVWEKILTCYTERVRGLAIPYVVAEGHDWNHEVCGLLFMDRLRIASVLNGRKLPDTKYNWWKWCEKRISIGRES